MDSILIPDYTIVTSVTHKPVSKVKIIYECMNHEGFKNLFNLHDNLCIIAKDSDQDATLQIYLNELGCRFEAGSMYHDYNNHVFIDEHFSVSDRTYHFRVGSKLYKRLRSPKSYSVKINFTDYFRLIETYKGYNNARKLGL